MSRSHPWCARLLLGVSLALSSCGAAPKDRHVQPQRPTLGVDTSTTPEDELELELGAAFKPNRPRRDAQLPATLKLGLGPRTELFGGLSLWRSLGDEEGLGDARLGLRHRLWNESYDRPATAFQLATKLPAADEGEGLGSGEIDFFVAGIHTRTVDRTAFTLFYQMGLLGEAEKSGQDIELALSSMADTDLTPRLAAFAELAGVFQPENDLESVSLNVGCAYRYAPWLYLDLGLSIGLTSDAPDVLLLVGLTRNLGRVLGSTGTPGPP